MNYVFERMAVSDVNNDLRGTARLPPRRVMHVITGLDTGGAEAMLANLVIAQAAAPHPPMVVSLLPGGAQAERIRDAGIEIWDLDMTRGRPTLKAALQLAALIKKNRPRFIQGWMYHADLLALVGLFLSGRRKKTWLLWGVRCSDMDVSRYRRTLKWLMRLCAMLSSLPDAVVANSHAGRRLHRSLGYRPRNFLVVPNGVDTDRYRPDPEARRQVRADLNLSDGDFAVGTTARVDPMKDYPNLLAALGRTSGVFGVIAGRGTENLPDQKDLMRLGERDDIPRLLNGLDVFVSSSAFGEGFSNSLAEAMATGLPVIATDVGDSALIVRDCGLMVPPSDTEALVNAIEELRDDPDRRARLGRAARERVEAEFGIAQAVHAFEVLYAEGAEVT